MSKLIERPIIFSGAMICALLEGRKTQTRRVFKTPQKIKDFYLTGAGNWTNSKTGEFHEFAYDAVLDGDFGVSFLVAGDAGFDGPYPCPYGKPGDRLWVRETWAGGIPGCESQGGYSYKADHITGNDGPFEIKWRSPIHMPREASRIILEITGIRVERLQSITEQDAIAEGLKALVKDRRHPVTVKYGIPDLDGLPGNDNLGWPWQQWNASPVKSFHTLWDSIHADGRYPWDSNPWVWVVEFNVLAT